MTQQTNWDIRNVLIDSWIESVCACAPQTVVRTDEWIIRYCAAEAADQRVGPLRELRQPVRNGAANHHSKLIRRGAAINICTARELQLGGVTLGR